MIALTGGASNGDLIALAGQLIGVSAVGYGLIAVLNHKRRYLPGWFRQTFGFYCEGDYGRCPACHRPARIVTVQYAFGDSWLNEDTEADKALAVDCLNCGQIRL